ncbi:MAG: hypothetical protein H0V76_03175 [Blastocatellia bacterium]|nr:hypothetical protein [Blastocatellia bacterium]
MTGYEQVYWLVILSIAVASVAWTVTQEEIFREPREYCLRRSEEAKSLFERKFFYVFTCEYCFSHWVTLFFILISGFWLLVPDIRGFLIAFLVTAWVSNQWMSLYRRLRVGIKHENVVAEQKKRELNGEGEKNG